MAEQIVTKKEPLDIKKAVSEIQALYDSSVTTKYYRALIFGDIGTGKTSILDTCRMPLHVDSFDPGGTKVLRRGIAEGRIIVDSRYENEDPKEGKAVVLYEKTFKERKDNGYFNYFGTYALDSMTTLGIAAMNFILKKRGRKDGIPQSGAGAENDYVAQRSVLEPLIRDILTLPCDVILIAHPDLRTDENTSKKFIGPLVTGQMSMTLPLMFDEIYAAMVQTTKDEPAYVLLTRQNGIYRCRSRLSKEGKISMYEEQDIKKILAKAGYPTEDKPIVWKA
jgi:hypothetical protein